MKEAEIGGRLGAGVVGLRMASGMGSETGGGFDGAGSADGEEDGAVVEGAEDFIEVEGSFAEPADVRADLSAAFATRDGGGLFVELRIFKRRARARIAAGFEKFAVHVDDVG